MVLGEQDAATVLPHYLNVMENTPPLTVDTPESFITATMKTEESSSSLPVNETQTLDTTCVGNKSSAASSESSMAGSPDTESPVLVNEYVRIFQLRYIQEKTEPFFYFSVIFILFLIQFSSANLVWVLLFDVLYYHSQKSSFGVKIKQSSTILLNITIFLNRKLVLGMSVKNLMKMTS